ncbi:MAG: hypothetical protein Q7U80_05390 [Thiobacillus sp.]|nr:hypothetical protein [Thiobacillus sp.]
MHYLLFIGAFLWFAFIAPLKVTVATGILLVLVTGVVTTTTRLVVGIQPSISEAAKAVALSFFFLAIALLTLFSFFATTNSAGLSVNITGFSAWFVLAALLAAYTLGYKVSLGMSFGASATIAAISTVVSAVLIAVVKAIT